MACSHWWPTRFIFRCWTDTKADRKTTAVARIFFSLCVCVFRWWIVVKFNNNDNRIELTFDNIAISCPKERPSVIITGILYQPAWQVCVLFACHQPDFNLGLTIDIPIQQQKSYKHNANLFENAKQWHLQRGGSSRWINYVGTRSTIGCKYDQVIVWQALNLMNRQCADKKVSRTHAAIEVSNSGEVILTSVSGFQLIFYCIMICVLFCFVIVVVVVVW